MKIREWEITQHISELLGEEPEVFGAERGFILRAWIVRPGFRIYQLCEQISIGVDGLIGDYFTPSLDKITAESLARAGRIANASMDDDGWGDPLLIQNFFT